MIILVFCLLYLGLLAIAFHCFIHQFCLQLVTTSCSFAVNSSYCDIIDYCDNVVRISQNIAVIFFGYRTGLASLHTN